ncbi:Hypothetical predicted protein, partial [Paramuricea clavata]
MNKSASLITCGLLVFLALHFVVGSRKEKDAKFKVRINENGTRFSEKVKINEKENTVRFVVPKHNDFDRSEVLNEFNLNLTITRLPDVGVCYIKPLDKSLPSPRKMKSDMKYVKRMRTQISKPETVVTTSEWTPDKKLEPKQLHPTVVKFCAGLPVYRLKEITKDNWEIEENKKSDNDTTTRTKRRSYYDVCGNQQNRVLPCPDNTWRLICYYANVGRSCVYWVKCRHPGYGYSTS